MGKDRTIEHARRLLDRLVQRRQDAVAGWHRDGPAFWRDRVWSANVRIEKVVAIRRGRWGAASARSVRNPQDSP